MKKIKSSVLAKTIAIILFVISVCATVGSFIGVIALYEEGVYTNKNATLTENLYDNLIRQYNSKMQDDLRQWKYAIENADGEDSYYYRYEIERFESKYSKENTNYYCIIKDGAGNEIFRSAEPGNYSYSSIGFMGFWNNEAEWEEYIFESYVRAPKLADDSFVFAEKFGNFVDNNRYVLIVVLVGSILLDVLIFVFLMCSAGHRKGQENVTENFFDKIPFDVLGIVVGAVALVGLMLCIYCLDYSNNYLLIDIVILVLGVSITILSVLFVCMTFATRCKLGTLFKNMLIVKACRFVIKVFKTLGEIIVMAFRNIDVLWKVGIVYALMTFFEIIMICNSYISLYYLGFVLLWLLAKLVIAVILVVVLVNFKQVRIAAQRLAEGDINYKADTRFMFWDIRKHAENLNNIGGGLGKAVDEKMKSERLKTELITNVSHDIKTPLTSIINYVDLLKKEELENEKAGEYLEVLDRQSHRLKKLTEDLVEASKASTGNISVDRQETELGMLLSQALGEYEERIKAAGLTTVLRIPEEPIMLMTDGRLLWRVFDNLFSNICKYSMPDTRVYVELQAMSREAIFIFRNISKYELNISSDELMERFVRGDSSRNTEGSGLGLSIAKSLVELLGGEFSLKVDGDLFKVVLSFKVV